MNYLRDPHPLATKNGLTEHLFMPQKLPANEFLKIRVLKGRPANAVHTLDGLNLSCPYCENEKG